MSKASLSKNQSAAKIASVKDTESDQQSDYSNNAKNFW